MTRLFSRYIVVSVLLFLPFGACVSADEKARRNEERMVEAAKEEIQAESLFVQDSIKLTASITQDTVDELRDSTSMSIVDNVTYTDHNYRAVSRSRAVCAVDSAAFARLTRGDTLSCQWEPSK